jgi:hypothetical protein
MGAPLPYGVRLKRALDRGVVPDMGIPAESQHLSGFICPIGTADNAVVLTATGQPIGVDHSSLNREGEPPPHAKAGQLCQFAPDRPYGRLGAVLESGSW